jgi:VWFA-related protein
LRTQKDVVTLVDGQGVKRTFGIVLSVLILVISTRAADPGFVLHKRVGEVRLTLIATDSAGRPWSGLSASSLAVSDEGLAIPNFEVRTANDLPLQIGILLDLSDSTHKSWPAVRAALQDSMHGLLQPGDQILMMTFNSRVESEQLLNRPQEFVEALPSADGGLTALYDALHRACEHPVFSEGMEPRRSALILFSDGEDTSSYRGLAEAIASAERSGIAIYTISTHKPNQWQRGDGILRHIARSTGGRDFVVKDPKELRTALQTINEELRSSYLLYYRPPSPETRDSFRRVEVLPARDAHLQLRTRAGYYSQP